LENKEKHIFRVDPRPNLPASGGAKGDQGSGEIKITLIYSFLTIHPVFIKLLTLSLTVPLSLS